MAMFGGPSAGGTAAGVVAGGLCIGALLLGTIASVVVLSLIAVYTPDRSKEVNGEEYAINSLMLKTLYSNVSSQFENALITNSGTMSDFCTAVYKNTGETNVAGCLLENFYGYGPYGNSITERRRRQVTDIVGMYSIGKARIFYSTPCIKRADRNKYVTSTDLSACVRKRLTACNNLFKDIGTNLFEWTPKPATLSYSLRNTTSADYITLTVLRVFGVRKSTTLSVATNLGLSNTVKDQLLSGCQYIGQRSQTEISTILGSQ